MLDFLLIFQTAFNNIMINYHHRNTDVTYMHTFVNKMLLFLNDADIRNFVCHLNEAISNLNRLQVICDWIYENRPYRHKK